MLKIRHSKQDACVGSDNQVLRRRGRWAKADTCSWECLNVLFHDEGAKRCIEEEWWQCHKLCINY